jgi:hypothetical protein|tara:strand:- start:2050 stop:2472 length:423 start_codon:yes stop_codon:yes gene_type:complete
MAFSQYLATKILSWVKNSTFPSALSNVYVSLHTADPGTAGTNNDVTASVRGVATRVGIAATAFSSVGAASGGGYQITNSMVSQQTTSAANTTPVTISHFGLWDTSSAGNFLASGTLTTNVEIQQGDTVQFNSGAMAVKVL